GTAGATTSTAAAGYTRGAAADGPIVFAARRSGTYDMFTINPDGKGELNLTHNPTQPQNATTVPTVSPQPSSLVYLEAPAWSPSKASIVFDGDGDHPGSATMH